MSTRLLTWSLSLLLGTASLAPVALSAQESTFQVAGFEVSENLESVDVMAGSSSRLTFDFKVPELQIENPEIVRATCVSPTQINLTGIKPGVSTLTVSDPDRNLHSIIVNVMIDTRKLELTLKQFFTDSAIRVTPLQTGVLLTGYVARSEDVNNVMQVTTDFFPTNVVNQLRVDGAQVVATEVKVYEVSRSKLRNLGIDWAANGPNGRVISGFSDLIADFTDLTTVGQNMSVSVFNDESSIQAVLRALEQRNVARLMSQPTLISQNGRPAELLSGGEIPIQVAVGLGTNSITFRSFGTKLDVVPIVHGQGELTLEVRAEVSEVAPELAGDTGVPGFRVRRVNTGVPMRTGQTLALAGVYSETNSAESKGAPGLVDKPWFGSLFRNVRSQSNETELVFLLTPRMAGPVDASTVPGNMPGRNSADPSNFELYINGHIEVPRCQVDCPENNPYINPNGAMAPLGPAPEMMTPAAPVEQPLPAGETAPVPPASPVPADPVQATPVSAVKNPGFAPSAYRGGDDYFDNEAGKINNGSRFGYPGNSETGSETGNGWTAGNTDT